MKGSTKELTERYPTGQAEQARDGVFHSEVPHDEVREKQAERSLEKLRGGADQHDELG